MAKDRVDGSTAASYVCFLIGRLGSSTFRLSAAAVSMLLAGSCFSSKSAPRPFHHRVRGRGGAIYCGGLAVRRNGRIRATMRTHLIHRPARDIMPPRGGARVSFYRHLILQVSCCCGLSRPAELGAVHPDAVHDHGQSTRQRHDRLFHPATPGDLHRPRLEPAPFLRTQHALSGFVEHDPHHLIAAA